MRVSFHSSHVTGDFGDRELTADIVKVAERDGGSLHDRVSFSVPPDYHVHNDCVAAALLTLTGKTCRVVGFNFPISQHCADILISHYDLEDVGPVDHSLEPRRPGRYHAINFSGGTDSTALYLLMQQMLGSEFKVITCDFGERFTIERTSYQAFHRDITCRTDLRQRGHNEHGRFLASVPLLFADYLDLGSVASGHTLLQENSTLASIANAPAPDYHEKDPVYHAGGLVEDHLVRGLCTPAIFKIIIDRAPEHMEAVFTASSPRATEKYYSRAVWVRYIYREAGLPLPKFLRSLPAPLVRWQHNPGQRYSLFTLWAMKYEGIDAARKVNPEIERFDFSFLDDMSLHFMLKYNTNVTHLIPENLRPALLRTFHSHGIYPYTQRDWHELDIVRQQIFEVERSPALADVPTHLETRP